MAVTIMMRGPNKTVATLTDQQSDIANLILVDMMNRKIKLKAAEVKVIEACAAAGCPVEFK